MNYIEEFKQHCINCYPQEAVGVVIDYKFIPLENIAADPVNMFRVKQSDVESFLDKDFMVLHSHTMERYSHDPRTPSKLDMQCFKSLGVPFGIVHCDGESITDILWLGVQELTPLLNRDYIANKFDCFTLVADFYKITYDIEIDQLPRNYEWEEEDPFLISQNYEAAGFVEVTDIRYGDIILFSIGSRNINHIGVVIGEDSFLHHLHERKSSEDSIIKWKRQIRKIVRHKELFNV